MCEFLEIAGQWEFHCIVGEAFLGKPKINPTHRKINQKGTISDEQIQVNNLENQRKQQIGKNQKMMK